MNMRTCVIATAILYETHIDTVVHVLCKKTTL